jgi:hypothetical protein
MEIARFNQVTQSLFASIIYGLWALPTLHKYLVANAKAGGLKGQVLPWHHIIGPLPQPTLIKHLESATAQIVRMM